MSDSDLARHIGVTHPTVAKYRAEMESTCKSFKSTARTGRDGRTINTAKIGKNLNGNCRGCDQPKPPRELTDPSDRPSDAAHSAARHKDVLLPTASDLNRRNARHGCRVRLELPTNHVHNCAFDLLRHLPFDYLQEVFAEVVRIHQERSEEERR